MDNLTCGDTVEVFYDSCWFRAVVDVILLSEVRVRFCCDDTFMLAIPKNDACHIRQLRKFKSVNESELVDLTLDDDYDDFQIDNALNQGNLFQGEELKEQKTETEREVSALPTINDLSNKPCFLYEKDSPLEVVEIDESEEEQEEEEEDVDAEEEGRYNREDVDNLSKYTNGKEDEELIVDVGDENEVEVEEAGDGQEDGQEREVGDEDTQETEYEKVQETVQDESNSEYLSNCENSCFERRKTTASSFPSPLPICTQPKKKPKLNSFISKQSSNSSKQLSTVFTPYFENAYDKEYNIGDKIEVFYKMEWFQGEIDKVVQAGIRVKYYCDNSLSVVPHRLVKYCIRKKTEASSSPSPICASLSSSSSSSSASSSEISSSSSSSSSTSSKQLSTVFTPYFENAYDKEYNIGDKIEVFYKMEWFQGEIDKVVQAGIRVKYYCDNSISVVPHRLVKYCIRKKTEALEEQEEEDEEDKESKESSSSLLSQSNKIEKRITRSGRKIRSTISSTRIGRLNNKNINNDNNDNNDNTKNKNNHHHDLKEKKIDTLKTKKKKKKIEKDIISQTNAKHCSSKIRKRPSEAPISSPLSSSPSSSTLSQNSALCHDWAIGQLVEVLFNNKWLQGRIDKYFKNGDIRVVFSRNNGYYSFYTILYQHSFSHVRTLSFELLSSSSSSSSSNSSSNSSLTRAQIYQRNRKIRMLKSKSQKTSSILSHHNGDLNTTKQGYRSTSTSSYKTSKIQNKPRHILLGNSVFCSENMSWAKT